MKILLTCEHAGNRIPIKYKKYFNNSNKLLNSHRGYDIGAYKLFKKLSPLSDFSKHTLISRLLIDYNRSLDNKNLFSELTKNLSKEIKEEIINNYYMPYRSEVEKFIISNFSKEKILHLSIHSFTPVLNGKKRDCDIGILFNPNSNFEKTIAINFRNVLKHSYPNYKVKFNFPYKGTSDGFTTYLREKYPYNKYAGIELEVNQKLFKNKEVINKIILSV
ncbi:MAG: N-formylglutamate amidohydrolase, partial [Ignavibacteriales bacterium CG12_big_fil_rev_8_21_14_0_65_30_8]